MSERTTIGGTVYEAVGSSNSNLLLKCNGTARIQWGNKLIDLIKNGKIASGESSYKIRVISDKSEIKSDGIYILTTDESSQLLAKVDNEVYDLIGTDLYISASKKQDITDEQRKQALENIGMYFNTLEELRNSGIQNGIAYVLEDNNLYTIKEGTVSEFEAKLKTVTVEKEEEQGEIINSSLQIILSVLDEEYIVLKDKQIIVNKDIRVKDYAQIGSENADVNQGYRLYIDKGKSYLDVDKINVREGIPQEQYIEVTFSELRMLMQSYKLIPHSWYLVTDYQSPWKIPKRDVLNNRPILIRALTGSSFYKDGQLFKDRRVTIQYDPLYEELVKVIDNSGNITEESVNTRGRIIWMKDGFNNEANFDFLDYEDALSNPLTTLHEVFEDASLDLSVFPKNSYNNKLTAYDLKGTVIKDGIFDDTNTTTIDFKSTVLNMHDNDIQCRNLIVSCENFYNNSLKEICKTTFEADCINSNLTSVYTINPENDGFSFEDVEDNNVFIDTKFSYKLDSVTFKSFINSELNNTITQSNFGIIKETIINESVYKSTFNDVINCIFDCQISNVTFMSLTNCTFNPGVFYHITCFGDLIDITFDATLDEYTLLYDTSKTKEIYINEDGTLEILSIEKQAFMRGMIIMHSGLGGIPSGWAPCDGGTHTYDGITSVTPNLVNKFIKAVDYTENVGEVLNPDLTSNNEFTLEKRHLPEHNHPHQEHTHTISGTSVVIENSGDLTVSGTQKTHFTSVISTITDESITSTSTDVVGSVTNETEYVTSDVSLTGGNHTHSITITEGTISNSTSKENSQTWENQKFKIEPNYYALIFIMKL